jgi:aryl-alcohol dehydrogenase-like predicted oxidoreductase
MLMHSGKARSIGLSNASLEQIKAFSAECPLSIYQGPFNMLQRALDEEIAPWCRSNGVAVATYWVLMRGILTGDFARGYTFAVNDKRGRWPICQDGNWQRLQDLLDILRDVARESGKTVAQVVVRWALEQSAVSTVLCGASRARQVRENAEAMNWTIQAAYRQRILKALSDYGITN